MVSFHDAGLLLLPKAANSEVMLKRPEMYSEGKTESQVWIFEEFKCQTMIVSVYSMCSDLKKIPIVCSD